MQKTKECRAIGKWQVRPDDRVLETGHLLATLGVWRAYDRRIAPSVVLRGDLG